MKLHRVREAVVGDAAGAGHVAVGVGEEVAGRDGDQPGGSLLGDEQLGDAGVALADHPDLAVLHACCRIHAMTAAPSTRLLRLEEVERALGAAGAAQVDADVGVAAVSLDELADVARVGVRPGS